MTVVAAVMITEIAEFGPPSAPVKVAAWSSPVAAACSAMRDMIKGSDGPVRLLVQGGPGAGKTRLCAALAAAAEFSSVDYLFLSRQPTGEEYRRLSSPELQLAICDGLDGSPGSLTDALARSRRNATSWLVTSNAPYAPPVLDPSDRSGILIQIPPFDQEPSGATQVALLLFEEMQGVSLVDRIEEDALQQLASGPWPRNGLTMVSFVNKLALLLELDGALSEGELHRNVNVHDISGALLEVIRDERRETIVIGEALPVVVVEGVTDKMLLEAAAAALRDATGEDLVGDLEIIASDGASKIPGILISLEAEGRLAVGLFDGDAIGVDRRKTVNKVGRKAMTIPLEMGELHSTPYGDEIEIEDLLPSAMLDLFYTENPDTEPETRIVHKGRVRVVPEAEDKFALASWCRSRLSVADYSRLHQLLRSLRASLGLS